MVDLYQFQNCYTPAVANWRTGYAALHTRPHT